MILSTRRVLGAAAAAAKTAQPSASAAAARAPAAVQIPQFETIVDLLESRAASAPHSDALISVRQSVSFTFSELLRSTKATARGLIQGRCRKGDAVISTLGVEVEGCVLALATSFSGNVYAPLSRSLVGEELRSAIASLNPRAFVIGNEARAKDVYTALPELQDWPHGIPLRLSAAPNLKLVVHIAFERFAGMISLQEILFYDATPDPLDAVHARRGGDAAFLAFSPASTSALTQSAVLARAAEVARKLRLSPGDRLCSAVGSCSVPAHEAGTLAPLVGGATIVLPESNAGDKVWECVARHSCGVLVLSSKDVAAFAKAAEGDKVDTKGLRRVGVLGGVEGAKAAFATGKLAGVELVGL